VSGTQISAFLSLLHRCCVYVLIQQAHQHKHTPVPTSSHSNTPTQCLTWCSLLKLHEITLYMGWAPSRSLHCNQFLNVCVPSSLNPLLALYPAWVRYTTNQDLNPSSVLKSCSISGHNHGLHTGPRPHTVSGLKLIACLIRNCYPFHWRKLIKDMITEIKGFFSEMAAKAFSFDNRDDSIFPDLHYCDFTSWFFWGETSFVCSLYKWNCGY
jgi:hypothetical protein